MKRFQKPFRFGAGDAFYLEPLSLEYLSHFTKLMEAYQAVEEEK